MLYPTESLNNPYYWVEEGQQTLFRITNDLPSNNHGCATHKVTYNVEYVEDVVDGEPTLVLPKQQENTTFYDIHGDRKVVREGTDGVVYVETVNNIKMYTVERSDGTLNEQVCSQTFPFFTVTLKNVPIQVEGSDPVVQDDIVDYYWLQNRIETGDSFTGNQFVLNTHDGTNKTYLQAFTEDLEDEIRQMARNGSTPTQILNTLPFYAFKKEARIAILGSNYITQRCKDGETYNYEYESVDGFTPFTKDQLYELYYEGINEEVVDFANGKLETLNQRMKSDVVIVKKANVEDVPRS